MNYKKVTIFIPCLVDQVYPEVGIAMCRVLSELGFELLYNPNHTCCGQPAFNSGQRKEARAMAAAFIDCFQQAEVVVSVSGSCTAMVRNFYPELFVGTALLEQAKALSGKVLEFSQFLVQSGSFKKIRGAFSGKVGFHNSCHSRRELGIINEPYQLFEQIEGCSVIEPLKDPVCCGFGGVFSVKFPDISEAMARSRLEYFAQNGADIVVTNDPGCLMQMRQQALADGYPLKIVHLVEFIAQAMSLELELSTPSSLAVLGDGA